MAKMDKYEKEILDSFEKGEWISVSNIEAKKKTICWNCKEYFIKK